MVEIRKSLKKRCLSLGPIYLESTTPEVFKTSFGKIPKTRPSETIAKNPFLEVTLLNKINFFNSKCCLTGTGSRDFTKTGFEHLRGSTFKILGPKPRHHF